MIHKITIENFQGTTGTFSLEQNTIVSGQNGSGKSTLIKAIQLLLMKTVPGDEVNDTVDEQYNAYCGQEAGMMSIEISCSLGKLKRTWSKTEEKVSTQATFNDQAVPANSNYLQLIGLSVFNVTQFWRLTPSQQIAEICNLAGVDPNELDRLDDEIERTQTHKKKLMDQLRNAQSAAKDHELEIQQLVQAGRSKNGINVAHAEEEIKELEAELQQTNDLILNTKASSADAKSRHQRINDINSTLSRNTAELKHLHVPDESYSLIELENEIKKQEEIKVSLSQLDKYRKRLDELKKITEPTPPAYNSSHIRALQDKIVKARSSQGLGQEDKIALDVSGRLYEEIKELDPLLHEAERTQCLSVVYNAIRKHKAALQVITDAGSTDDIDAWNKQIENIYRLREEYGVKLSVFHRSRQESIDLENIIQGLESLKYDEDQYRRLIQDLESRKQKNNEIEIKRLRQKELVQMNSRLSKELNEIQTKTEGVMYDLTHLEQRKVELDKILANLKESIRITIEFDKLDDMRQKKVWEVEMLTKDINDLKTIEYELIHKKASLLNQVEETLTSRASKIIRPGRISFELPKSKKKTDRIKFWLHKDNGDKIDRKTLCGSEQVEFDLALAYALVGKGGLISTEVAELTIEKMDQLVNKVTELNDFREVQTILVGHTLQRFEKDPRIAYVSMDHHVPPKYRQVA